MWTGLKKRSHKPVVKILENQCIDQCMVELGLSDWKSDFKWFRRLLNVNLKILIFGSDKDWSSSVGSTTMLQKSFNPLLLSNQFFWRRSTRFLFLFYQETLNFNHLISLFDVWKCIWMYIASIQIVPKSRKAAMRTGTLFNFHRVLFHYQSLTVTVLSSSLQ